MPERAQDAQCPGVPPMAPVATHLLSQQEVLAPSNRVVAGKRIGPYEVLDEIGHGGMGTVYRAVRGDGDFRIQVAVKVISRGADEPVLLDRFRAERQILAKLEHPNIARLLDGGATEDGLLYFVMEYVDGKPLTKYCDSRSLPVSERLHLVSKLCDAVSYAHRSLVVHRDLKPDNILVTDDGVPKLLDFGIARILESSAPADPDETVTIVRMATPAYASPEQIRGEQVGVASDIYALGVLLYELLTGRRPYRLDSQWEKSARIICEQEPARASVAVVSEIVSNKDESTEQISRCRNTTVDGLRKRLSGDLDNILAVALQKDPSQRYRSVDRFQQDLENHLNGRPVMARGDSLLYRAKKFVGRHTLPVAAVTLMILTLCVAGVFIGLEAQRLARRVDTDRELASSFLTGIHDIARLPGSTPVRQELLTKSLDYLNGLAREDSDDRQTQMSLALAYERFADLLAGVGGAGLGKPGDALKTFESAKRIREQLAREFPRDAEVQADLASNYMMGSYIVGRVASVDQRREYDRKALDVSKGLASQDPANDKYQALLAAAYTGLAYSFDLDGRWVEAAGLYQQAVPIRERHARAAPQDRDAQRELANIHYRIGVLEAQAERPQSAMPELREALQIQKGLLARDPGDRQTRFEIAGTDHFLGVALGASGSFPEALASFRAAISIREAMLATDKRDARTRSMLAGNYAEQSTVLLKTGRKQDALKSIDRSIQLEDELLALDDSAVPARVSLADYEGRRAAIHESTGQPSPAAEDWSRAVALWNALDREGYLRSPDVKQEAAKAREALQKSTGLRSTEKRE
jgi:non-specific serine/threonine protein kinase/serine/threonine-protein kinase